MKPGIVFLIDDDGDDQEMFCSAMQKIDASIQVHCAENATDAVQQLQRQLFVPDVIFVDLNMPLVDGFQFLKSFPKTFPLIKARIIVYTTTDGMESRLKARQLGAWHFVPKPATYGGVITILQDVLAAMDK